MPELKGATVRRGGVTAHYWFETIQSVFIDATSELRLRFSMRSKGGGRTQVQVEITPQAFPQILQKMATVNPEAAIQAMTAELARQIQLQPARHAAAIQEAVTKAHGEIRQRARTKYISSFRTGPDEKDRPIYNGIVNILTEVGQDARKAN